MSASVGSAHFSLRAKSDQLGTDIKKAMGLAQRRLKSAGKIAGRTLAASMATATAAITAAVTKGIQSIDHLAKTSDKLGIPIEKLQQLQAAAGLTGVATTQLETGLQRMTRRVAEAAQGTGEAVKALQELNLDARELATLSPDQIFLRVGEAMRNVGTQGDRVRLAMKLFDSEGVGLVNTLKLTQEQLDAIGDDMDKLGTTIDRNMAAKVERAKDQFSRLGLALTGVINQLTIHLAPIAGVVAEKIIEWSKATGIVNQLSQKMAEWVADVIAGLSSLSYWAAKATQKYFQLAAAIAVLSRDVVNFNRAMEGMRRAEEKADKLLASDDFVARLKRSQEAIRDTVKASQDLTLNADASQGETILGEINTAISQLQRARNPLDEIKLKIESVEEALKLGLVENVDLVRERLAILKDEFEKASRENVENVRYMTESWQQFAFNATSAIDEFVESGRFSIKNFVRDMIKDLAKIHLRRLLLGGSGAGGILGSIGSAIGLTPFGLSKPGKAMGGPVAAGQPTIVGERGAEIFQPSVPGQVIPHIDSQRLLNKSGGNTFNFSPVITAGVTRQELALAMQQAQEQWQRGVLEMAQNGGSAGAILAGA